MCRRQAGSKYATVNLEHMCSALSLNSIISDGVIRLKRECSLIPSVVYYWCNPSTKYDSVPFLNFDFIKHCHEGLGCRLYSNDICQRCIRVTRSLHNGRWRNIYLYIYIVRNNIYCAHRKKHALINKWYKHSSSNIIL